MTTEITQDLAKPFRIDKQPHTVRLIGGDGATLLANEGDTTIAAMSACGVNLTEEFLAEFAEFLTDFGERVREKAIEDVRAHLNKL